MEEIIHNRDTKNSKKERKKMTLETFNVKKDMVSRYFHRDKWKDETGVFQYPRGKRRSDAITESLEIVFDKNEFTIEKELTLRGDNVLGNVFIVSITMDTNRAYMALTITDHLFALMMLPENCIDAISSLAKCEDTSVAEHVQKESDSFDGSKEVVKEKEQTTTVKESNSRKEEKVVEEGDTENSVEDEIDRVFQSSLPEFDFPDPPEI